MENEHIAERNQHAMDLWQISLTGIIPDRLMEKEPIKPEGRTLMAYCAWLCGIATAAAIYAGINPIAAITISAIWVYLLTRC